VPAINWVGSGLACDELGWPCAGPDKGWSGHGLAALAMGCASFSIDLAGLTKTCASLAMGWEGLAGLPMA
jgi:hypothetical protein